MDHKTWLVVALITMVTGMVLMVATGQPARQQLLDEVQLSSDGEQVLIVISMTVPVRYLRRFPYEPSKELRINVELVAISPGDRDGIFQRETIRPTCSDVISLQEVIYEGDIPGNQYITLMFGKEMPLNVSQGRDSRSVIVALNDTRLARKLAECLALDKKEE